MPTEAQRRASKNYRLRNLEKYRAYQREHKAKVAARRIASMKYLLQELQKALPQEEYDQVLYTLSQL